MISKNGTIFEGELKYGKEKEKERLVFIMVILMKVNKKMMNSMVKRSM